MNVFTTSCSASYSTMAAFGLSLALGALPVGCAGEAFEVGPASRGGNSGMAGQSGGGGAGTGGIAGLGGVGGQAGTMAGGGNTAAGASGAGAGGSSGAGAGGAGASAGASGGAGMSAGTSGGAGISGGTGMSGGGGTFAAGAAGAAGMGGAAGMAGKAGQGGVAGAAGGVAGASGAAGLSGQSGAGGQGDIYIPVSVFPTEAQILPPTHAFLSWKMPALPVDKKITDYTLCSTVDAASGIDDVAQCPGEKTAATPYSVLGSLKAVTANRWKVRANFAGGGVSAWSAVRVFMTDDSLVGRWEMNGNASDASPAMNNGTLQNGASFGSGFVMQGLHLDGMNDHMTVSDQPAFDFGGNDFTLSAWVFTQETGANQVFIEKRDGANGYLFTRRANGALRFHGDVCGVVDGGMLTHGGWHHVAARRNGSTVRTYIDGAEVGSGDCVENFSNAALLTFGCNTPTIKCTEPLSGTMDDAMLLGGTAPEAIQNEFCAGQAEAGVDPLPPFCLP